MTILYAKIRKIDSPKTGKDLYILDMLTSEATILIS